MDRARRRIASALDGIRAQFTDADSTEEGAGDQQLQAPSNLAALVREKVEPAHCRLVEIVRHGFPDDPRCMAFDPVQRLCAIGAARGCVRLIGQAGVDHFMKHASEEPVTHIQFLVNEGGLVTALADDTLHLWNYRQRTPEIVHSLRMSKERISALSVAFQSRWLNVGTDKGNVYFVCLATFELSNYVIQWNKAIDLSCRTHPGCVKALECCPVDASRLLVVFERGPLVQWNVASREVERFAAGEQSPVSALCWHNDGKEFMCGHQNGSLSIWNVKRPRECVHRSTPHSPNSPSEQTEPALKCKPITALSWHINADGEQLIVFAGGMPTDEGALPSLTVMRAKGSLTVLEMDHAVVAMVPLLASPYASVAQHPHAIAVLLRNDLLVVDMHAQGYPCFEVPHPIDMHESPLTLLRYFSDCPVELIAALTLVGRNQRKQGVRLSDRQWPINGGVGRECATGHQEMLLTGHEDGSIKFWQASSEQLQLMYKLKTGRHFEKSLQVHTSANDERMQQMAPVSHAVADVELCVDSRLLLVASRSGQVTLFRFAKTECCQEIAVVPLPQLCRSAAPQQTISTLESPPSPANRECTTTASQPTAVSTGSATDSPQPAQGGRHAARLKHEQRSGSSGSSSTTGQRAELRRQAPTTVEPGQQGGAPSRHSSHSTDTSLGSGAHQADWTPLKVRGGALRRPAGYQPELVCQVPWWEALRPEPITGLALNSAHCLVGVATANGVALVDAQTAVQVYAWCSAELLGREPLAFWCSRAASDTLTSPTAENLSPSPPIGRRAFSRSNYWTKKSRLLKHQLSAQSAPGAAATNPRSPPPNTASSGHLSRGNTTDSQDREKQDKQPALSLSARLTQQRPQLTKAFTFNPQSDGQQQQHLREGELTPPPAGVEPPNCNGKTDSRHSSTDSLERTDKQQRPTAEEEHVCALHFINSCAKKDDSKLELCLWLGTSAGAALALQLQVPPNRIAASVVAAPSGSILRQSGRILHSAFLDRQFRLLACPTEQFKASDPARESAPASAACEQQRPNRVLTKASLSPVLGENETISPEEEFSQLALFVSEWEIRAILLPSYRQLAHRQIQVDEGPLVRAKCSHVGGGHPVLVALSAAGNLLVMSVPSLRILLHTPLLDQSIEVAEHNTISARFDLSEHGLGMRMVSPSEVQKFTVNAEIAAQVAECMGELFVPCDMPEAPKQHSFLRGILAAGASAVTLGGAKSADPMAEMDAILREKPASAAAGSMLRTVARPLLTPQQQQLTAMELGTSRSISAGQAAQMAMQNLGERGERLSAVTDATEQLRNNAQNIQQRSAKLLEKYEKRKWYQL